jgi:hypothetical protein
MYGGKKMITIDVDPSDTIEIIKQNIEYKEEILSARQRLVFDGKTMENSSKISDYNMQKECTCWCYDSEIP